MFNYKKIGFSLAGIIILIILVTLFSLPRAADKLSADFATGSFSLTSNNNYCVGQTPVYTITAPSGWSGQTINWSSAHNGSTGSQTTFTLNSNGSWSQPGNSWGTGDVGQWTKTASINGSIQTLTFSVQNCGGVAGNASSSNPTAQSIIGSSNDSFGAGSDAVNIAFPVNTVSQPNSNLYGGFNGPDTPAPVYLSNGTIVNGSQTGQTSNNGSPYYDQNGFLCKPPGSW